jgi:uncharacterized membrane protein YcaP (DUF421 family)
MKLTDDQLIEALRENGHADVADALTAKLEQQGTAPAPDTAKPPTKPANMDAVIRQASGRG